MVIVFLAALVTVNVGLYLFWYGVIITCMLLKFLIVNDYSRCIAYLCKNREMAISRMEICMDTTDMFFISNASLVSVDVIVLYHFMHKAICSYCVFMKQILLTLILVGVCTTFVHLICMWVISRWQPINRQ